MIIHPTETTTIGTEILVSARMESQAPGRRLPENLWFRFPAKFQPAVDSDPFVIALLLLAMQRGEDIEVRGSLSRSFFSGLNRYQQVFHGWFPERFKCVEIRPMSLREESTRQTSGRGVAFSGGVDSFYSFLTLRETLTHTIFMSGFDMPCNLIQSIGELTRSYSALMQEFGIHFITGSTNVRTFVNSVEWTNAHGPALMATALFFKPYFGEFYIPSSYTDGGYPQWGSHPELDPLLSSPSLRFVHHGSALNRVRKLQFISRYPASYDRLRVCWIQDIGLKNCGRCEKCIRTQIALGIIEMLPNYTTFDSAALNHSHIRRLRHRTHQSRIFARELMKEAFSRGKLSICASLAYSLLRRELFYRTRASAM